VSIPTYILGPVTEAQKPRFAKAVHGGDLCENVSYLGQAGIMKIAGGLRVGYLSGYAASPAQEKAAMEADGLVSCSRPLFHDVCTTLLHPMPYRKKRG